MCIHVCVYLQVRALRAGHALHLLPRRSLVRPLVRPCTTTSTTAAPSGPACPRGFRSHLPRLVALFGEKALDRRLYLLQRRADRN